MLIKLCAHCVKICAHNVVHDRSSSQPRPSRLSRCAAGLDAAQPRGARGIAGRQLRGGRGIRHQRRRSGQREDLRSRQRSFPAGRWDQGTEQIFAYGMRRESGACSTACAATIVRRRSTCAACGRTRSRDRPSRHRGRTRSGLPWLALAAACRLHRRCRGTARSRALHRRHPCCDRGASTGLFSAAAGESPWTRGLLRDLGFSYASNGFGRRHAILGSQRRPPGRCLSCRTRSTATT